MRLVESGGWTVGAKINPGWQILAGHVVFMIVLVLRPNGLFPRVRDE